MPPRSRKSKKEDPPPVEEKVPMEPIVMQLPISTARMDELLSGTDMQDVLEYNPKLTEPQPYMPHSHFFAGHDAILGATNEPMSMNDTKECVHEKKEEPDRQGLHGTVCYWCCHEIDHMEYGMPIRYDVIHKNFTMYGSFCSLECVAAFNFGHHMGSDRAWEIHSWIQMLGNRYGMATPIRPAPSRYLLKMFQGPMTIEEFRRVHKGQGRTYVLNIPPFIHVNSQMEMLNTSFLDSGEVAAKPKKKTLIDKKTIEKKLPCMVIE